LRSFHLKIIGEQRAILFGLFQKLQQFI